MHFDDDHLFLKDIYTLWGFEDSYAHSLLSWRKQVDYPQTIANILKEINDMPKSGIHFLTFSHGENWITSPVEEKIKLLKEIENQGFTRHIFTNINTGNMLELFFKFYSLPTYKSFLVRSPIHYSTRLTSCCGIQWVMPPGPKTEPDYLDNVRAWVAFSGTYYFTVHQDGITNKEILKAWGFKFLVGDKTTEQGVWIGSRQMSLVEELDDDYIEEDEPF